MTENTQPDQRLRENLQRLVDYHQDFASTVNQWLARTSMSDGVREEWQRRANHHQRVTEALTLILEETPATEEVTDRFFQHINADRDNFLLRMAPPSDDPV